MQQLIDSYISGLSTQFFIMQVITILVLSVYGVVLVLLIRGKSMSFLDFLLSYPFGLIVYSIAGYTLLSFGITFNRISVILLCVCFTIIAAIVRKCKGLKILDIPEIVDKKKLCFVTIAFLILTLISVSGIIPISSTNDSMYFFSEYPRALIHYGKLTSILDNFLTDASQGVAIIGTLPFFFGFDEVYGIQTLLNIVFIAFFTYATFDYSINHIEKKKAYIMSALAILMLMTSMPFVIMSRWFMANSFFMEYMTIIVYLAYKYDFDRKIKNENGFEAVLDSTNSEIIVLAVFTTGLSIMRMEGALNAGVLILFFMMLSYRNRDVVTLVTPMLILQSAYLFRIFKILTLHTGIQFMNEKKALVLIAFLVCILLYSLVIRNRFFTKIKKYYPWILIVGLTLVNLLVLLRDTSGYIVNLKAFIMNVIKSSGWGLFASFVIGTIILIPKKSIKINYFDFSIVGYILLTIVAGWARGDSLYEGFGDSGNRILIQVVPLVLFAIIIKAVEGIEYWKKEELG